jgi:hypothetical protein
MMILHGSLEIADIFGRIAQAIDDEILDRGKARSRPLENLEGSASGFIGYESAIDDQ